MPLLRSSDIGGYVYPGLAPGAIIISSLRDFAQVGHRVEAVSKPKHITDEAMFTNCFSQKCYSIQTRIEMTSGGVIVGRLSESPIVGYTKRMNFVILNWSVHSQNSMDYDSNGL